MRAFIVLLCSALALPPQAIPISAQTTSASSGTRTTEAPPFADTLSALAAGDATTCVTTTAGAAYCWGALGQRAGNVHRIVGPDSQPTRLRFVTTSAFSKSCGVTTSGDVWCVPDLAGGWIDSTGNREAIPAGCLEGTCLIPLRLRGSLPPGRVRDVATGAFHACALAPNGSAHCWGANRMGQLGTGVWAPDSTGSMGPITRAPTLVTGRHRFSQISANDDLTCGVTTPEHHVYCWGYGQNGETGDSSIMRDCGGTKPYFTRPCSTATPTRVLPESFPGDHTRPNEVTFVRVAAGVRMACAISENGEAYCWGSNYRCELGRCRGGASARARHIPIPGRVVEIAPGYWHACARTADRRVFCWGNNTAGQLGSLATVNAGPDGKPPDYRDSSGNAGAGAAYSDPCFNGGRCSPAPVEVLPGRRWVALALGTDHACALAEDDGGIYCWGGTDSAALGRDARLVLCENRSAGWKDERCQPMPVRVPGLPSLAAPPTVDALAIPPHERARRASRYLQSTRVLVSAREVRVVFPPDTSDSWRWPASETPGYALPYYWGVNIDGMDGPRHLELRMEHSQTSARTFPSLQSLVAAAEPGLCTTGMMRQCNAMGVTASVDSSRVVLAFRDPRTITRLFGLRPDSVQITRIHPDDPSRGAPVRVAVEYVRPQIPIPDAAVRAEAARARRRYRASITSITRNIAGGPPGSPAMWIAVGDSIPLEVRQYICTHDVCTGTSGGVHGAEWTIDDTAVVRVGVASPAVDSGRVFSSDGPRTYLVGRALGRTRVRVSLPPSWLDTMPSREPPARRLAREVVVSPRAARLEIASLPDTVRVGRPVTLTPRVFDESGAVISGAPVEFRYSDRGTNYLNTATGVLRLEFKQAGSREIVARFGVLADTLRVTVVGETRP